MLLIKSGTLYRMEENEPICAEILINKWKIIEKFQSRLTFVGRTTYLP